MPNAYGGLAIKITKTNLSVLQSKNKFTTFAFELYDNSLKNE